jgi:hypothetical protein
MNAEGSKKEMSVLRFELKTFCDPIAAMRTHETYCEADVISHYTIQTHFEDVRRVTENIYKATHKNHDKIFHFVH